ncbi:hypothetical protein Tco_1144665 [Tanacetum coccineum]
MLVKMIMLELTIFNKPQKGILMRLLMMTREEPKKISKALKDDSWVEAMQEEFLIVLGLQQYGFPDIMFAVCAYSRFQVTPKTSHLNAVKRIFKYLKGKLNLGLWYPRESSFDLEAYSDSDYAGENLNRKSTTSGCQFLRSRLISWQCKKQTIVATSTTEVEYVAAASCYGQVLWIQNQMLDYGFNFMNTKIHIDNESIICIVKNPVYHSKTKHIEIRHHFIRDSYEKKLIVGYTWTARRIGAWIKVELKYALTHNLTIHDSLVKQFWHTATASTLADGTLELRATIDTLEYTITEASVRSKLQLADASGISMLPNTKIFEGMGNMGIYNFSKLIFDGMVANLKSKTKFLMYPRFLQMILEIQTENKHPYLAIVLTKKIFGNMKRGFRGVPRPLLPAMLPVVAVDQSAGQADQAVDQPSPSEPLPSSSHPPVISATTESEPTPVAEPTPHPKSPSPEPDSESIEHTFEKPSPEHQPLSPIQETKMDDLLQLVPKLITKVDSLETELNQTKLTIGKAFMKLVKKVKKMEDVLKRRHVVLPDSEDEDAEISSKRGRNLQEEGLDEMVRNMVKNKSEVFKTPTQSKTSGEEDISHTTLEAAKTLLKVASQRSKLVDKGKRYKRRKESKGKDIDTGFKDISTGFEDISTGFEEVNTGGLGVKASLAEAIRLQTLEEEESAKQVHLDALLAKRMDLDALLAKRMEEEELTEQQKQRKAQSVLGKELPEEDFAKKMVELVNQRKKFFAEERAKARRSKPMTQSLLRNYMMNYLKNQRTWKLTQLKKLSFEEVKEEFDKLVKQVESFVPINIEATKAQLKRYGEELQTEISKKQRIDDKDVSDTEEKVGKVKEEEPVKRVGKRKKQKARKGKRSIYQLIEQHGADTVYMSFGAMLKDFTREDLIELYRLVMQKYGTNRPEDAYDIVLWSDLRTMFDLPLNEDAIWVFKTPTQSKTSGEEDISHTTLEAAKTLSKVAS